MLNMGLLDFIFGKPHEEVRDDTYYQTFTESSPVFTPYNGGIAGQELTRAAIERFATACSKLKPELIGHANRRIVQAINTSPNGIMTWSTFLKRTATIFESDGTAFVVPSLSADGEQIEGFFPLLCDMAEIVEFHGVPWIISISQPEREPQSNLKRFAS